MFVLPMYIDTDVFCISSVNNPMFVKGRKKEKKKEKKKRWK
jgi:hypothetical protein